jgi:hypothetical protein
LLDLNVELKEQRVYPSSDFLTTLGVESYVRSCFCTAAIRCNMAGVTCHWAYNSPGNSRF